MSPEDPAENIATAITDVSERALQLVHEEIELAKAEVAEKTARLIKGAIVGFAAAFFVLGALVLILQGLSWLAWFELPVGRLEFFWGFFLVAGVLLIVAALAAGLAARAVRSASPPVPSMALEEARRIRETVSAESTVPPGVTEGLPGWDPLAEGETAAPRGPAAGAQVKAP